MLLDQIAVKYRAKKRAKDASNVDLVSPFTRLLSVLSVLCLNAVNFERVNKTRHFARDRGPG